MLTISCIIPTLGRGKILCNTIEMLLSQSYPAHEIIVIDQTPVPDEKTRQTLESWRINGAIQWLHQTEPNASKARNTGALVATGDVVLFLDDDIRIAPDFLAVYAATFQQTNAVGVCGQVLEGNANEVDELPPKACDLEVGWTYFPRNYSKECETSFMMSGNVAIRRYIFLAIGGMDENYERGAFREEADFAQRLARKGYRLRFQPRASIFHLGFEGAAHGGSRNWTRNKRIAGFHHCIGDWYFNLCFARRRLRARLFWISLRHFVMNRYNITNPWWLPILFVRWLAAFPVALMKRTRGARLISPID